MDQSAESTLSGISDEMDEEAGETTLYFDAADGTLRDEDGDEVTFEMGTESSAEPESLLGDEEEEEDGEEGEEEEEGSQTPHAGQPSDAAQQQRPAQTITSTSANTQSIPVATRTSRLRRLSSATQSRVSTSVHMYRRADCFLSLRCSNPATDSTTTLTRRDTRHLPAITRCDDPIAGSTRTRPSCGAC